MNRSFWPFLLMLISLGACVSNKKVQYLHVDDVNVKDLKKDTVLRSYAISPFEYRIQTQDALFVRFESSTSEQFDFLSNNQQSNVNVAQTANLLSEIVDEQGEVSFPVLGKVKVSGLTIFEIEDKLQLLANQYLESTKVRVRIVNFRFTVLGEVFQEGSVSTFNNRVSIPEALGLAGGLGDLADRSNIKIIRQQGDKVEVGYFNLLDENFINSPFYYVHQNDILVVPPLEQRPFRKYFGQNFSLVISSLSLLLVIINLNK